MRARKSRSRSDSVRNHAESSAGKPEVLPFKERITLEVLGSLRDTFDEATQHVLAELDNSEIHLGPLVDIPMAELEAGAIGWKRVVSWEKDSRSPTTHPGNQSTLYLIALPQEGPGEPGVVHPPPLRPSSWNSFVFAKEFEGPPRSIVLARAGRSGVDASPFRRFAEFVWEELDSEWRTPGD